MNELLEDIRLNKIAYILEKIEKENDPVKKVNLFKKIEKYKITKKIGLFLIENSTRNYNFNDEYGGISSSLIELCFKDYFIEYNDKIEEVFGNLNEEAQDRVLVLLTTVNDNSAIKLYTNLVIKYYKNRNIIPIGDLTNKPLYYPYLFPKLYKALKYGDEKNNILILLNEYLNSGTVVKDDLKKNKKIVIDSINKIFSSALKYKFKNTYEGLNNQEYKELRYFLEVAVNIELYVSNKKTKEYLEKLLKKNDNQIKLFILDNYLRKDEKINKINLNPIARDKASRYALFDILSVYEQTKLMPKRYLKQELLAESDFYTNFVITSAYTNEPLNLKYIDYFEMNNFRYYVFKFKTKFKVSNANDDYLINYIYSQLGIKSESINELTGDFVGISGGYEISDKPSRIKKVYDRLLIEKINPDDDPLEVAKKSIEERLLIEKNRLEEQLKIEENKKKKADKKLKQKKQKVKKDKRDKKKNKDNRKIKGENKEIVSNIEQTPVKVKKQYHIFAYILLFLFAVFIGLLVYCVLYIYGVGSINDGIEKDVIKAVKLDKTDNFIEIPADQIFNQAENEYLVLLYSDPHKETNKYYGYINQYVKRGNKLYFVDLNKEENKFLYSSNGMNFTLSGDRLLKVKEHEYEYYVDGKRNILNHMQEVIENMIKKENEAKETQSVDK